MGGLKVSAFIHTNMRSLMHCSFDVYLLASIRFLQWKFQKWNKLYEQILSTYNPFKTLSHRKGLFAFTEVKAQNWKFSFQFKARFEAIETTANTWLCPGPLDVLWRCYKPDIYPERWGQRVFWKARTLAAWGPVSGFCPWNISTIHATRCLCCVNLLLLSLSSFVMGRPLFCQ